MFIHGGDTILTWLYQIVKQKMENNVDIAFFNILLESNLFEFTVSISKFNSSTQLKVSMYHIILLS